LDKSKELVVDFGPKRAKIWKRGRIFKNESRWL